MQVNHSRGHGKNRRRWHSLAKRVCVSQISSIIAEYNIMCDNVKMKLCRRKINLRSRERVGVINGRKCKQVKMGK